MAEQTIEQKIKDYLYFHLSNEKKEYLKKYLEQDHFTIDKSKEEIDKTMPITLLVDGLINPDYIFEEGKTAKVFDLNIYNK